MRILLIILGMIFAHDITAQQIIEAEYFIDSDPGFGLGIPISITANQDISDLDIPIDLTGISEGIHNLNVRAKDDNGSWSLTHKQSFLKRSFPTSSPIDELEYYFDNDPGEGSGTSISISSSVDIANHIATISTSGISEGVHKLHLRAKNQNGIWSHVESTSIFLTSPVSVENVVEMEYFFNNDPGYGNGISVSNPPAPAWSNLSVLVNTNSLGDGAHILNLRAKDSKGIWSLTKSAVFLKTSANGITDITEMEYFFNSDPGYGNGTSISIPQNSDINNQVTNISTSGLSKGVHKLYIRSKNQNGIWSLTNAKTILKVSPETTEDISEMEYYFDVDPGFGLGTSISIANMPDITDLNSTISLSGLSKGVHRLFIRTKDNSGKWSLSYNKAFLFNSPDVVENIEKIEYFVGEDPGLGNGIDIAVPSFAPESDIADLEHLIDIADLNEGVQRISIRSKNDLGVWSHTFTISIYVNKNINGNMVKAEYFIDTDPGFGMATEITFSPEIDKSNHLFQIDLDELDYGIYRLHVRYMSEHNKWTMDEIIPFHYKNDALYNMITGEYFFDEDPGFDLGTSFTFPSAPDVADLDLLIFPVGLDAGLHDLYIRTKNANDEWSLTNIKVEIEVESTLPLNFLSFDVKKRGKEAHLNWKVSEAFNTSHFEIERAKKNDFQYIGELKSINDIAEQEYQFVDRVPLDGINYYRLKQIDLDGNYQYSAIRSVNFGNQNNIVVYPNPSINELRIDGILENGASFKLYDASNRLVIKGEIDSNASIDVSNLNAGAYHFILQNGQDYKTFLIIKI